MKFSEIKPEEWPALKPYLDTCLLPITGLAGTEEPWQATEKLEQLRDLLDKVETPFTGRVVTYPAYHFTDESLLDNSLSELCRKLKAAGFVYVVAAFRALPSQWTSGKSIQGCDLILSDQSAEEVRNLIAGMWAKSPNKP